MGMKTTGMGVAAVCALALTACGSSSGGGGGDDLSDQKVDKASVKCGAGTGKAATGKPIKIRAVATASGGVDFSSSPKSAKAYFDCLNANGGINGRPVDYAYDDDALNPQKTGQIAAKYASDPSVVALAGDATFIGCSVANNAYKSAGLYSVTGVGVPRGCFESSNIAPVNAGPRISAIGNLEYFQGIGKAGSVVQVGTKTAGNGDWVAAGIEEAAKAEGIKLAKTILHDPGVSDANSIVLDVKSAKPTVAIIADPAPDTAAILKGAATQGLADKLQWSCTASCYDSTFPGQIGDTWEGFVSNSELQLVDAKTPDNLLWRQVLDTYGSKDDPRDTFGQAGFLAAKITADTLMKLDPAAIDRKTASKALLDVKNYKSDLLCAPWYYGEADEHNANHATRQVQIKGGKYVELKGCQAVNDPGLKDILAREQSEGLAG